MRIKQISFIHLYRIVSTSVSLSFRFAFIQDLHGFLYPADALRDFELVFRRENIEKFEMENSDDTQQPLKLDESLQVIGALLNALKKAEPASKRWTQEALKAEMMDHGVNLSSRLLDEYFSAANKSFKSAR